LPASTRVHGAFDRERVEQRDGVFAAVLEALTKAVFQSGISSRIVEAKWDPARSYTASPGTTPHR
jgi:hypothetical protein